MSIEFFYNNIATGKFLQSKFIHTLHTCMHTHIHINTNTRTCAYMHTQNIHRYTTYVQADKHTLYTQKPCVSVYKLYTYTYLHTILTYLHAHARTHRHMDAGTFVTDKHCTYTDQQNHTYTHLLVMEG